MNQEELAAMRFWQEAGLSVRPAHCLATHQISNWDDLLSHSDSDLLRIPNFGRVSLDEVKDALLSRNREASMPAAVDPLREKALMLAIELWRPGPEAGIAKLAADFYAFLKGDAEGAK